MRSKRQQLQHRRAAFTLIELLVSISIIALLIGLLLPAINGARRSARIAEVTTEIKSFENALAAFKAKYGSYPPSRITLHSTSAGWTGDNRSRVLIRKFWPSFNFATDGSGSLSTFSESWAGESITLDGPECLVFFLGGIRETDGTYIGFSNNPANPFTRDVSSTATPTISDAGSRTTPFFEFRQDRLTDVDGDLIPEYHDPLPGQQMPYLYVSGYDGKGYSSDDLIRNTAVSTTAKWMENIYTQGTSTTSYWNRESFQIISPGFDGTSIAFDATYPNGPYGPGGQYDSDSASTALSGPREVERDNITNFGGVLAP